MRLTRRCTDLLYLMRAARWLTTAQIQRRFFPAATPDAVRKRLRKLTKADYLLSVRRDRMSQALFTLGQGGKRLLETMTHTVVALHRTPPIQLAHFLAVNDLRIAAELAGGLTYFYAAWELPGLGWKHPVIPDGLVGFGERTFAMEFDRGVEGIQFFVRTKVVTYTRGLENFPLTAVLVITDRTPRMMALATAVAGIDVNILFTTLDLIVGQGLRAPVFYTEACGWGLQLPGEVSCQSLSTTRELQTANTGTINEIAAL
jgi:hypothetical protein